MAEQSSQSAQSVVSPARNDETTRAHPINKAVLAKDVTWDEERATETFGRKLSPKETGKEKKFGFYIKFFFVLLLRGLLIFGP